MAVWHFLADNRSDLWSAARVHARIVLTALAFAVPTSVLLGTWAADRKRVAAAALGVAGVIITIPSYALFGLLVGPVGIGSKPAIIALSLYSVLPVLRNTIVGLQQVPSATVESARGMGMTERQVFTRVRLPLAAPVILAGIRTATVMIVGITTIAAYIAAGGLGTFVRDGLASQNRDEVIGATLCIVGLAFFLDGVLALVQRRLVHRPAAAKAGVPRSVAIEGG